MTQATSINVEELARDLAKLELARPAGALLEGRISVARVLGQVEQKRNARIEMLGRVTPTSGAEKRLYEEIEDRCEKAADLLERYGREVAR